MIRRPFEKLRRAWDRFAGSGAATPRPSAAEQLALACAYRQLRAGGHPPLPLADAGFRAYSQHEEDGILWYILALVGTTDKRCVEICAGNGIECNTANLLINHKWTGLLCDGDEQNIEVARRFYESCPDTRFWPPVLLHEWLTRENVDGSLRDNGFHGGIDLLSLDVDGVDYWLWQSLTAIEPRVVVLEVNHLWGPDVAATVPYRPDFRAEFTAYGSDYAGASLKAFVDLGREKGYRLVGTNAFVTNAFFVRDDIDCDWLPEVTPQSCFGHPRARFGQERRLPAVRDRDWVFLDAPPAPDEK